MYSVGLRDRLSVAHGPTDQTAYDVNVEIEREELDDNCVVIALSTLHEQTRAVLSDLDKRNLAEHPAFQGRRATAELLARHLHRELGRRIRISSGAMLSVTLTEAKGAWARYRAPMRGNSLPPPDAPSQE